MKRLLFTYLLKKVIRDFGRAASPDSSETELRLIREFSVNDYLEPYQITLLAVFLHHFFYEDVEPTDIMFQSPHDNTIPVEEDL